MEQQNIDAYAGFAERYDWMKGKNPVREQFFKKLFEQQEVSTVLDCACGTGQDALMLSTLGYQVCGSDLSESMLEQARRNITETGAAIPLKIADFRDLKPQYDEPFDAVVCLTNAINEPLEDEDAERTLQSIKSVLQPGGILVFDQGQTDASMKNPPRFAPVVNTRDYSRLFAMEYESDVMNITIFDFIHTENTTDIKTALVSIRIRLQENWEKLLNQVGFSNITFFGGWDGDAYNKESSSRLIVVAEK